MGYGRVWAVWATWAVWALGAGAGALLPLEAERLRASVGGYAVMNCHLDFPFGNEIPYHLQWDKDGESIFSWWSGGGGAGQGAGAAEGGEARVADRWGGRVRRVGDGRLGLGRGSINVSAVRETDAGLYRCRVTFPNRTPPARNNGTFYYLEVDGGNLIATPPLNVTVLEGERAELECLPKSPEWTVEWYREGAPLTAAPELAHRSEVMANGSLVIRAALSSDPGEYTCRVRDDAARSQHASAFLDVHYKAKVVYAPKERYLPLGKPASLDCHFSANPPLTNLRWEKDGFLFDPYNVPGVFYSRNGSLLFNQVDESHEGHYSCTPYNALGTSGPSPRVRVRVQHPPRLLIQPQPIYVARLGSSITLPCVLDQDKDDPHPTPVEWTRNEGAPLPEGRHSVAGGNLTLVDVRDEDTGEYRCTARNDADTATALTDLIVENIPLRAPTNVSARPHHTTMHVEWQPGNRGVEVEFHVWYRERAASEWRTLKVLSRGVSEATLAGLRPATEYEVRVLAQDLIGDGLFSKPLYVRTLEPREEAGEQVQRVEAPPEDQEQERGGEGGEVHVEVRLLDEGALVTWARAGAGAPREPCLVHWYEGERLVESARPERDYLLVRAVTEGERYEARVHCAAALGAAALLVPHYSRLQAVAGGCAGGALLLAALAGALYAARRRLRAARPPPRALHKR